MAEQEGLDDAAIEQETAVTLPERDAMSIVSGVKLVPMTIASIAPEPQISPDQAAGPVGPPPSSE